MAASSGEETMEISSMPSTPHLYSFAGFKRVRAVVSLALKGESAVNCRRVKRDQSVVGRPACSVFAGIRCGATSKGDDPCGNSSLPYNAEAMKLMSERTRVLPTPGGPVMTEILNLKQFMIAARCSAIRTKSGACKMLAASSSTKLMNASSRSSNSYSTFANKKWAIVSSARIDQSRPIEFSLAIH